MSAPPRWWRRGRQLRVKRALDLLIAPCCFVLLTPLLAFVWLLVRTHLGRPALLRQQRPGYLGRTFTMYKFRTMTEERDEQGQLLPDEERLTKLGQTLRRISVDELPELINVLRGEMSLVGPRPLLPEYLDRYTSEQRRRHEMPPGMTGPVQVNGRNSLSWEDKFVLDLAYVDNWRLRTDLKIFCVSLWKVLSRDGIAAHGHATMPLFVGSPPRPPETPE